MPVSQPEPFVHKKNPDDSKTKLPQARPVLMKKDTLQKAKPVTPKKLNELEAVHKPSKNLLTSSEKPAEKISKTSHSTVVQREVITDTPAKVENALFDGKQNEQTSSLKGMTQDTILSDAKTQNLTESYDQPAEMTLQKKIKTKQQPPIHIDRTEAQQIKANLKPPVSLSPNFELPRQFHVSKSSDKKPEIGLTSILAKTPRPESGQNTGVSPSSVRPDDIFSAQNLNPLNPQPRTSFTPATTNRQLFTPAPGPSLPALLDMTHARPVFRGGLPGGSLPEKSQKTPTGFYPAEPANNMIKTSDPAQTNLNKSAVSENNTPPSASNSSAGNVVQRMFQNPEDDLKAAAGHVMGKMGLGGSSGDEEKGQGSSGGNLDKLAEDVLPLVKRLLEIERDRSSGYLR
ncbi:MAG: hypothetical protein LWX83_17075 [Anaerolineae bacterium]|nr:hypothetical protein [Anaerolineae bacterium]